jgi:hypothetical protein
MSRSRLPATGTGAWNELLSDGGAEARLAARLPRMCPVSAPCVAHPRATGWIEPHGLVLQERDSFPLQIPQIPG